MTPGPPGCRSSRSTSNGSTGEAARARPEHPVIGGGAGRRLATRNAGPIPDLIGVADDGCGRPGCSRCGRRRRGKQPSHEHAGRTGRTCCERNLYRRRSRNPVSIHAGGTRIHLCQHCWAADNDAPTSDDNSAPVTVLRRCRARAPASTCPQGRVGRRGTRCSGGIDDGANA